MSVNPTRPLNDPDAGLMCDATDCPNRWSRDMGSGRLCRFHAASPRHLWPLITHEQQEAVTDRARYVPPPLVHLTHEEKADAVTKLRAAAARLRDGDGVNRFAWAVALQNRRAAGLPLSPAQRSSLAEFERRHGDDSAFRKADLMTEWPGPDEMGHLPPIDADPPPCTHDWTACVGGKLCYHCGTNWWANEPEPA